MTIEDFRRSLQPATQTLNGRFLKLIIYGPPRTKKNSAQLFTGVTDSWVAQVIAYFGQVKARDIRTWIEVWKSNYLGMDNPPGLFDAQADQVKEWLREDEGIPKRPHPTLLPSEPYRKWHAAAWRGAGELLESLRPYFPIVHPVHIRALFFADADRGDLINYEEALADFLEDAGVLEDDCLALNWDGSRLLVDRDSPRIELWIAEHHPMSDTGMFLPSMRDVVAAGPGPLPPDHATVNEAPIGPRKLLSMYNREPPGSTSGLVIDECTSRAGRSAESEET